jgi:protein-tyrosine phosphatase
MIDLHCHILHGVDDGSKSLDESIEMARWAAKDGIKKIVATPHLFRGDFTQQDLSVIPRKLDELRQALHNRRIDVEIVKGAEVHITHNVIDKIRENRDSLMLDGSSYLIIEFPAGHIFSGIKDLLFEMLSGGIRPIIAHPERNYVFMSNPDILYELVKAGAMTQANSGSFTGLYGKKVEEAAFRFLELNLTHVIGSDAHNARPSPLWLSQAVKNIEKSMGEGTASSMVNDNPGAVLEDKDLPYLPDPVDPRKITRSFKIKIPRLFRK